MPKQKTSSLKKTSLAKTTVPKKKSSQKSKPKKIKYQIVLSSSWSLFKKSLRTIEYQKKFLSFAVVSYAVLSALLVVKISSFDHVSRVKSTYVHGLLTIGKNLSASLSTLGSLSGTVGGSNNSASSVLQFLLFLIFSLIFIKAIREASRSRKLKFSDGVYTSCYPIIQFLLVIIILALESIPILFATYFFNTIFSNGIAPSWIERTIWTIVCAAFLLFGLYLLISSIFSLFIVTLPNMRPWASIKSSWKLVKSRRLLVARKIIAMIVSLFVGLGILALILVWLLPVISAWVLLILGLMSFVLVYTYMYSLYRELL